MYHVVLQELPYLMLFVFPVDDRGASVSGPPP